MPPMLTDRSPRPEDGDLRMLGCRRSTFELVLRREVLRSPRVSVAVDATVRALEFASRNGRRVVGVRTHDGRRFRADIVVDACGRRSPVTRWLADSDVAIADGQAESCHITYYTRFYRLLADELPGPLNRGFGAGGLWDHYTAVLFSCDNRTFSVSVGVLPDDGPMKALHTEPAFTAAVRATGLLAPWLGPGVAEPISGVYAMGGLDNSLRGVATTRQPAPVLGLYHIGDSVCTTNPAYGRGISLALAHAYQLADVLATHPDVDDKQAGQMAAATERLFSPWLSDAMTNDRGRALLWKSTVQGTPIPPPPKGMLTFGAVVAAAAVDPVVWRGVARMMMMLDPPESLYRDEEIRDRVGRVLAAGQAPQVPGASRAELVDAVTAAGRR
jgi:2-polyprenyl-6-methoxyphenol hydroxylase-like FAD-dependent oxidoreductase